MKRAALLFFLCVSAVISLTDAQKRSTSTKNPTLTPEKLNALKATGTKRYTDKEILGATGLQIGQNAADGDFREAAQILGNSGMFGDVVYTYTSTGAGVRVEFQLTDIDQSKLVPAHFDNLVWFTDDELSTELRHRVPLFQQLLPVAGNLTDRVSEALQSLLTERHIPGRVNFLRQGDENGGALHGIDYHVEEVGVRVHGLDFPGASPEQAGLLTTAARRAIGAEYSRGGLAAVAKFDLLPVYLQRGYLKATFGEASARVLPTPPRAVDAQGPAEIEVDAIVPVTPGKVYSTSDISWKGNTAIATTEVAPLIHLAPGQPADAVRLDRDLESVNKLYRSRGYMTAKIKPDAQFDDGKSMVHYDFNVVEGDLYKMGDLEINGLDTQSKARMVAAWTLREGEPYNAEYPKKFLEETRQLLPRGVPWAVSVHETVDAKDKTVDVEIRFKQQ
jgi:outer membrane protein assembly factor BamA